MNQCSQLDNYLVNRLSGAKRNTFKAHLARCETCRNQADSWANVKDGLKDWADTQKQPSPSATDAARFIVAVQPKSPHAAWHRPVVYAGVAAAAIAIIVSFAITLGPDVGEVEAPQTPQIATAKKAPPQMEPSRIRVLYSHESELLGTPRQFGRQLSVPEQGHLLFGLGKDLVGLDAKSKVEVVVANAVETRIRLLKGTVAVTVEPRRDKTPFIVEAGRFRVEVVGTRFTVKRTSKTFFVGVDRGEVAVLDKGDTPLVVTQGQTIAFGQGGEWRFSPLMPKERNRLVALLTRPKTDRTLQTPSVLETETKQTAGRKSGQTRSLSTWRNLILKGRYDAAEKAISTYLSTSPNDTSSWSLLANCQRKAGKWPEAVSAYNRVIKLGAGSNTANLARFEAAVLLQDKLGKHARAGVLLTEYLKDPLLLEAEAMVRLARSKRHQGRTQKARQLLEQVQAQHQSTSAAIQAGRMLKKMDESP